MNPRTEGKKSRMVLLAVALVSAGAAYSSTPVIPADTHAAPSAASQKNAEFVDIVSAPLSTSAKANDASPLAKSASTSLKPKSERLPVNFRTQTVATKNQDGRITLDCERFHGAEAQVEKKAKVEQSATGGEHAQ